MKIVAIDHAAGTNIVRDMTAAELSQHQIDVANGEAQAQAAADKAAAAASGRAKLAALGLTNDEINALLGA